MAVALSVAEAQAFIGGGALPTKDLANTSLVQTYVDAVNSILETLTTPLAVVTRTVVRDGGRSAVVLPWPFTAVVSIVEAGTTLQSTDYDADLDAGIIYRGKSPCYLNWYPGVRTVTVQVSVGVAAIPGNVKLAAYELFRHLWQSRQGPGGAFAQPNGVDVVVTSSGYAIPNRVLEMLAGSPPLAGFA